MPRCSTTRPTPRTRSRCRPPTAPASTDQTFTIAVTDVAPTTPTDTRRRDRRLGLGRRRQRRRGRHHGLRHRRPWRHGHLLADRQCRRPLRDRRHDRRGDGGERRAARLRDQHLAPDHGARLRRHRPAPTRPSPSRSPTSPRRRRPTATAPPAARSRKAPPTAPRSASRPRHRRPWRHGDLLR